MSNICHLYSCQLLRPQMMKIFYSKRIAFIFTSLFKHFFVQYQIKMSYTLVFEHLFNKTYKPCKLIFFITSENKSTYALVHTMKLCM